MLPVVLPVVPVVLLHPVPVPAGTTPFPPSYRRSSVATLVGVAPVPAKLRVMKLLLLAEGTTKTLLMFRLNADNVYRPAPATFWLVGKYGPFQAATAPAPYAVPKRSRSAAAGFVVRSPIVRG